MKEPYLLLMLLITQVYGNEAFSRTGDWRDALVEIANWHFDTTEGRGISHILCKESANCIGQKEFSRFEGPWITGAVKNISDSFWNMIFLIGTTLQSLYDLMDDVQACGNIRCTLIWTEEASGVTLQDLVQRLVEKGFEDSLVFSAPEPTTSITLYTYLEFQRNCVDDSPLTGYTWVPGESLKGVELFPRNKTREFGGCPIKVGAYTTQPYIYCSNNSNGEMVVNGTARILIDTISRKMNFKPVFECSPLGRYGGENSTGAFKLLLDGNISFYFSVLPTIPMLFDYIGKSNCDCLTWCIPSAQGGIESWERLIRELPTMAWIFIFSSTVLVFLLERFFVLYSPYEIWKPSPHQSYFRIVMSLISQPDFRYSSYPLRCLMLHWMFFILVIDSVYQGLLSSILSAPPSVTELNSFEDLANSDVDLLMYEYTQMVLSSNRDDPVLAKIMDKSKVIPSHMRALDALWTGDHGLQITRSTCLYSRSRLGRLDDGRWKLRLIPECFSMMHYTFVTLRKGSPLYSPMEDIYERLHETGHILKWVGTDLFYSAKDQTIADFNALSMAFLGPVFKVLVDGLLLSALVFVAERCYSSSRWTRNSFRIRCNKSD